MGTAPRRRLVMLALLPGVFSVVRAQAEIVIFGNNGCPRSNWGDMHTFLVREGNPAGLIAAERSGPAQWAARVAEPGVYAAAVEDAYGFGPVVRTGIIVAEGRRNRVNVLLEFPYDLVDEGVVADREHGEYGQTFVARGTSITAIVLKDAEYVQISMHEGSRDGRRIGRTVAPGSYYPHGTLPTVPGQLYYLSLVRQDGSPFRMQAARGNRYPDGEAFFDGRGDPEFDLALRIQQDPVGRILRHKPGMTSVHGSARHSQGQTFIARGTGLALVTLYPVLGARTGLETVIRFREDGPGGAQMGPDIPGRMAVFGPKDLPLAAGRRYYIEVTAPEEFRMWSSMKDDFEGGELYMDGRRVPGRDLAMILVEYDRDDTPPPMPQAPSWRIGMPPYAQRFAADGRARLVWDVPDSNDISKVRISRRVHDGERPVAEVPVSARGRYQYVIDGLANGEIGHFAIRTVDAAGNESDPLHAPVAPMASIPMAALLLNTDLDERNDGMMPVGWTPVVIAGNVPAFQMDGPESEERSAMAFGWEVPEGRGMTDTALYQQIPCEWGRSYEVSVETKLWNPWDNREMIILSMVGIDTAGGTDPLADSIVWSSPTYVRHQRWNRLSVSATAEDDRITVFLRGYSNFSRLMYTRFRDVTLTDVTTVP